ncbi:outer membrane protein transport protein [Candidatus Aminicenantes bacterium AH-873-B07]|jgi:long-chain fatty acid transport protein|nr:outer membrane protein transport protein [Candidatus Aminicenantes bacterium AH-873-B07]
MKLFRIILKLFYFGIISYLSIPFLFGNGFNLNSIGSRALSMGGAYIGLADDFSAIFWNPAGLTQIDQTIVGVYIGDNISFGSYKYKFPLLGINVNAKTITNHYLSGMVAYCRPISDKLITGLAIYMPSHTGAEWDGNDLKDFTNREIFKWFGRIGIIAFSPVIAYKINDYLSFGATLNVYYGMMALKLPALESLGQYEEDASGYGYGASIGILLKPLRNLSFGFTFKTSNKIDFEGRAKIPVFTFLGFNSESNFRRDIIWPMWVGIGIAFKPLRNLIFTSDIQWTQWSKEKIIYTFYDDYGWRELFKAEEADKMEFYWEDKIQFRFGMEFSPTEKIAVRAGYYYDPAPGPNKTMNILLPTYTFNVLTFGIGYKREELILDIGFEYMIGKKRKISIEEIINKAMPGVHHMRIIVPTITFTYFF